MSAFGLFQVYWQEHQLADMAPTSVAWIGSVFGFLDCFLDLPYGMIFDRFGVRAMLPIGCLLYWASFLVLAWCETFTHFMAVFTVAGLSAGTFALTSRLLFFSPLNLAHPSMPLPPFEGGDIEADIEVAVLGRLGR